MKMGNRFVGFVMLLSLPLFSDAAQIVLSDDGREVQLNDDGSWTFVSEDRFATTETGERIRLGADGSWSPADDNGKWVTLPSESLQMSRDSIRQDALKLELDSVLIESVRTTQQKNRRLSAQLVLTLQASSADQVEAMLDAGAFSVRDSRGKIYPVKSVSPTVFSLKPGGQQVIRVIADGSPRWWGVKFFELKVIAGALGNAETIEMTKSMAEVLKRDVDALTAP